jgi:phosphopantetheinyl transferase
VIPEPTPVSIPAPGTLPAPVGAQAQVWWARVAVGHLGDGLRVALAADLDPKTLARLDRFHRVQDRDRGLAAHSLLRRLLAAVAGGSPSRQVLGTRCASCGETDHGKPYLVAGVAGVAGDAGVADDGAVPIEVNLSHSGEVVCVALAAPGRPVGVDVEQRRTMDWSALRRSVFADSEWAVTERRDDPDRHRMDAWARKESSVKATGHGLALPFHQVLITDAPWGGWTASLPSGAGSTAGWDVRLGPDVAAAVAMLQPPEELRPPVVQQVTLESR